MADNASIARPYAKAVFELARESNAFDAWKAGLTKLAAISQDEQFQALVSDPKVADSKVAELLVEMAQDVLPEGGTNLVNLLVQNNRLSSLTDVNQQFDDLVAKAQASVNAEVVTAKALTEDQRNALAAALEARMGLKVKLDETVDESLVGGAIIRAGDLVIDGSAKGRIEKLTSALMR